jgi:hypothetical protein
MWPGVSANPEVAKFDTPKASALGVVLGLLAHVLSANRSMRSVPSAWFSNRHFSVSSPPLANLISRQSHHSLEAPAKSLTSGAQQHVVARVRTCFYFLTHGSQQKEQKQQKETSFSSSP